MPDAAYLRKQARTCRKLAETLLDRPAKASLLALADEYEQQAEKLDLVARPPPEGG